MSKPFTDYEHMANIATAMRDLVAVEYRIREHIHETDDEPEWSDLYQSAGLNFEDFEYRIKPKVQTITSYVPIISEDGIIRFGEMYTSYNVARATNRGVGKGKVIDVITVSYTEKV